MPFLNYIQWLPLMLLINFCCSSFQSVLQAQKIVKLAEMVGQGKAEEEPEGQVIARPSREAVGSLSSGNIPFFLFGVRLSF